MFVKAILVMIDSLGKSPEHPQGTLLSLHGAHIGSNFPTKIPRSGLPGGRGGGSILVEMVPSGRENAGGDVFEDLHGAP
jgi:hypothetical protein